ncbi:hypothetical protein PR048_031431 [Dryococelus australis]|uniref:Uncharacterized protein n=1 Tax=Dryococelus australis TaxID=614101 RepID=A0ABQ9G8A3_9NEOP|nr:hypothetical protein PR048_031431 [Dryococelus australis]
MKGRRKLEIPEKTHRSTASSERPLLIYDTKFDIRQWFLVTCAHPMTIWMYRESYLRFCSQCFDILNFHESVHISNNAVQSKYKNGMRDPKLPDENMWDCYTFQTYLSCTSTSEALTHAVASACATAHAIALAPAIRDALPASPVCYTHHLPVGLQEL